MLKIREATEADIPTILRFIQALATFEKLSHEVTATEQALRETLFSPKRHAEVLLADWYEENAVEPIGFALFFHNYSTFLAKPGIYLEDLFVLESHRGRGAGKALLQALARIALDRNCGRLEWSVLDWNTHAIQFYESLGAKPMSEWTIFRTSGEALRDLGNPRTATQTSCPARRALLAR